ncbi:hypothetical protein [Halobacteriovorax sp. RZ-2]|uniref:hypothetical protein n=1 Tax=unclassified Halobacteriovorax TaxID=2639665 RepID=UPI0037167F6D
MRYIYCLFLITSSFANSLNEDFVKLVKKTASVYTSNSQIDVNNSDRLNFETLLDAQKVYLTIKTEALNTTAVTVINNAQQSLVKSKILPAPPVIEFGDLDLYIGNNIECTTEGTSIGPTDTSCIGKKCKLKHIVISKCNETDCWNTDSTVDRLLQSELSGSFSLNEKVDITSCLENNLEGMKHNFFLSEGLESKGGTVQYSIILQNDTE